MPAFWKLTSPRYSDYQRTFINGAVERLQRAAFIREQPLLWFFLLYAAAFLGCGVARDVLHLSGATGPSALASYLLPLATALPLWLGLRGWSRRAAASTRHQPTA
jgi:hypothetical protein